MSGQPKRSSRINKLKTRSFMDWEVDDGTLDSFDPSTATKSLCFQLPSAPPITIMVKIMPGASGTVAYSIFYSHTGFDILYKRCSVKKIIELLREWGAKGDFASLEKHLPVDLLKLYRDLIAKSDPTLIDPSSLVLSKRPTAGPDLPEVKASRSVPSPKKVASNARQKTLRRDLAVAYVRWAMRLSEDELMRCFGRGRNSLCPDNAVDAFKAYAKKEEPKLIASSHWDDYIRKGLKEETHLRDKIWQQVLKAERLMGSD